MSAFTKKLNQIKQTFISDYGLKKPFTSKDFNPVNIKKSEPAININRVKSLSRCDIKVSSPQCKHENYLIREPIIIETKNQKRKSYSISSEIDKKYSSVKKTVQPFVPLIVPTRDRTSIRKQIQSTVESSHKNRQIQIFIQRDKSQKNQCLQKLFKKIHLLQQQLANSQKERHRLQLQVQHLRKRNKQCNDHQKIINKLEGDKYKLQKQVELLKKQLKDENRRAPKQTLKQIIVQKPVEVRVEIPKYIPGPERTIQKIIEVEKKVPVQVKITSPPEVIEKPVYIQVQKPVYIDKPIYVDKPVYVNNPIQTIVEKKVQVPYQVIIQVPIYIDCPVIDQQWMMRLHGIQQQLGVMMRQNHQIKSDNHRLLLDNENLRSTIDQLNMNMSLLQQHNQQKNREVQYLLRNGQDYVPVCTNDISFTTRDNSFSSRNYMSNLPSPRSKRYLI